VFDISKALDKMDFLEKMPKTFISTYVLFRPTLKPTLKFLTPSVYLVPLNYTSDETFLAMIRITE